MATMVRKYLFQKTGSIFFQGIFFFLPMSTKVSERTIFSKPNRCTFKQNNVRNANENEYSNIPTFRVSNSKSLTKL